VIPGGASGVPGSAHYSDQLSSWQRHELVPMQREEFRPGE
jgi:acyl-homoserine lactone acylase PvdQ